MNIIYPSRANEIKNDMQRASIYQRSDPAKHENKKALVAEICDNFFSRFKGYMFKRVIGQYEALLFQNDNESKIDAAIHMFFMNFDLAVFWLDKNNKIVDKTLAKKWHPLYYPGHAAKAIIETHPTQFGLFDVGDQLTIEIL